MKFKIEFVVHLNLPNIQNNSWIESEHPLTIRQFLEDNSIKKEHQKYIIPTVNKDSVKLDYVIKDGDKVFLYLPVGGG